MPALLRSDLRYRSPQNPTYWVLYGLLKVCAAKLNIVLPQQLVKHVLFVPVEPRNASYVTGLCPHDALLCVTSASMIIDDLQLSRFWSCFYRWLCAINIVETFKHHPCIVPKATVDKSRRVLSVWEGQCHQMDENKLGANSCRKTSIFSIDIVNRIVSWSDFWGSSARLKDALKSY